MTNPEDLDRLFDAALRGQQAPSRFGTPEEQLRDSPIIPRFQKSRDWKTTMDGASQPASPEFSISSEQPAPARELPTSSYSFPAQSVVSTDHTISAELGGLLDEKVAREKRRRRSGLLVSITLLLGVTGGSYAWFVQSPDRVSAFKNAVAEAKSAGDIKGLVANYQKSLDKVAERGAQIDEAASAMGIDRVSTADDGEPGFDSEMREMMGEDSGPTSADRNLKLQKKFDATLETGKLR